MKIKKNSLPEISIIISVYNHEKWISRCLRSLFNQTNISKDDYEIIVVDDCSKDNSYKFLKSIENKTNIKLLKNSKNLGLPRSLNKAIKESVGRYIVRVDSDDYVKRNFLSIMRYFLNQNYNYGAVAVDYLIVDKHENILKRMNAKINEIACGIMYRRECIYEIGLFNDGFKMREGHELNKRFRKKFRIAHLELPLYKYRHYDGNRTKNIKKLNEYDNKLKKK